MLLVDLVSNKSTVRIVFFCVIQALALPTKRLDARKSFQAIEKSDQASRMHHHMHAFRVHLHRYAGSSHMQTIKQVASVLQNNSVTASRPYLA